MQWSLRRWRAALAVALGLFVVDVPRGATYLDGFQQSVVFEGLDEPTAVRFAADGRVFVAEKGGRILVFDDLTDPAPDLLQATPDGKYMAVAFRGPAPVTVKHTAQGSCPGVGIVALEAGGSRGRLVTVLRTTNSLGDGEASAPGGHAYTGVERSDVHGASVILKRPNSRRRPSR